MGAWGTSLYSDDLAADLRDTVREQFGDGRAEDTVLHDLEIEYAESLADSEEAPVFWLAVAHSAWKLGRPIARATTLALDIIASEVDLARWPEEKDRRKRRVVLERVA